MFSLHLVVPRAIHALIPKPEPSLSLLRSGPGWVASQPPALDSGLPDPGRLLRSESPEPAPAARRYTTIALVSALLSAVSFAAYSTPPNLLFSSASSVVPSPPLPGALAGPPPPLVNHTLLGVKLPHLHGIPGFRSDLAEVHNIILQVLWYIYGLGARAQQKPWRPPRLEDAFFYFFRCVCHHTGQAAS